MEVTKNIKEDWYRKSRPYPREYPWVSDARGYCWADVEERAFHRWPESHGNFLGREPRSPVMAPGGRSSSKNIRIFKVKVSSAKLLAMVEMVEWIGVWKSTKKNNNMLILKIIPGQTLTFWKKSKEKKRAMTLGLKNRICSFAYCFGA